ncbi:MAG: methyltransferase domain-containing protein [Planctomycetia bacterium]|nr:methyltransferase domain-containing protein [Planctomycetia bacterium]
MSRSALDPPQADPTPIFEAFRGNHATELLTAAVAHFGVFAWLAEGPVVSESLRESLGLAERPFVVLTTALKALGLLTGEQDRVGLTAMAREHLVPGAEFDVSGYVGLAAESPGVVEMVERLRTNRPAGGEKDEAGAAFIFREGIESAMEREESARSLTLALAGRARNVAPVLADRLQLDSATTLLDVGGGTGIYSIAWLQRHRGLKAVVWDRPEVLKVAREMAEDFGVSDRLETLAGDMFRDPVPDGADVILLSNVLHDWGVPECRQLVSRCAAAMPKGGRLLIHDVFLNDALDGPLPVALYSASLFRLTEGRAYSAGEYAGWLSGAGLEPGEVIPTLIHCGVLPGVKP